MISGFFARLRSLLRGVARRSGVESDMVEEFRHHIDLRTRDLIDGGVPPKEARRQAHLEFGHVETHREVGRASRGLRFFDRIRFSWIDVKLGLRMLVKYPGLTLVAVFALGIGIPVGLAPMHLSRAVEAPLPEDADDRIRGIRFYDVTTTSMQWATWSEYEHLREELSSFESLGAFRSTAYNLASDDGRAAPVQAAEVTASIFDLLGTSPVLGRRLVAEDEVPGGANVIVLGHDIWEARFAGDSTVVGRDVRVAGVPHTVIGVMPAGFLFPAAAQAWLPIRDAGASAAAEPRALLVIGRLGDGVGPDEAQAEISAVALNVREVLPGGRANLRPEVVPYGLLFMGIPANGLEGMLEFYFFQALALILLLVACGNVAMLVFARTATRFQELAVRTALGASRSRIVSQMFAETLVLSVLSAGAGLFAIDWILGRLRVSALIGEQGLPYWLTLQVTPRAMLWATALAALSATVAGVVPALRLTGSRVQENIRKSEAGRSGIKFGGVTGALVVADVAISVAAVGFAVALGQQLTDATSEADLAGIEAEEYLAVELRVPVSRVGADGAADLDQFRVRLAAAQQAIVERLQAEPTIRSVAVGEALPRMDHRSRRIELESVELPGGEAGPARGRFMRTVLVDVDFFRALGQEILAGRDFDGGDVATDAPPVIVNTVFADRILSGRDPIGHRLRLVGGVGTPDGPWHEIVGVVGHLGINMVNPEGDIGVYVPTRAGGIYPVQLGLHVGESPDGVAPLVREIVDEVAPDAILGTPVVLSDVRQGDWYLMMAVTGGLVLLVLILVTLAASGIYAIMSFSVSERTREIGIRTALGAKRSSLVATILRRSLIQVCLGALLGLPVAARLYSSLDSQRGGSGSAGTALGVSMTLAAGVVVVVALFSCVAPTRRALRIEPSEALRGAD